MKTVNIGDGGPTVKELVEQAQTEPLLLRNAGRTYLLAEVDEADADALALAQSDQFQSIIERSRLRAQKEGWLTTQQLREQLGL
jgi:hypothetical protein